MFVALGCTDDGDEQNAGVDQFDSDESADVVMSEVQPSDETATDVGTVDPIASCEEIASTDCFSNYDCDGSTPVCLNRGTELEPVPCCVAGSEGIGAAGSSCAAETDCQSAICIDGSCSDTCDTAEACPENLPRCVPIAFSGSDDNWCLPE